MATKGPSKLVGGPAWHKKALVFPLSASEHGSSVVTYTVGALTEWPTRTFTVHKNLLCRASKYFDTALNGQFMERSKKKLELPHDSPEAFEVLYHWVYTGFFYSKPIPANGPEITTFIGWRSTISLNADSFPIYRNGHLSSFTISTTVVTTLLLRQLSSSVCSALIRLGVYPYCRTTLLGMSLSGSLHMQKAAVTTTTNFPRLVRADLPNKSCVGCLSGVPYPTTDADAIHTKSRPSRKPVQKPYALAMPQLRLPRVSA